MVVRVDVRGAEGIGVAIQEEVTVTIVRFEGDFFAQFNSISLLPSIESPSTKTALE